MPGKLHYKHLHHMSDLIQSSLVSGTNSLHQYNLHALLFYENNSQQMGISTRVDHLHVQRTVINLCCNLVAFGKAMHCLYIRAYFSQNIASCRY